VLAASRVGILNEKLYYYRLRDGSTTKSKPKKKNLTDHFDVLKQIEIRAAAENSAELKNALLLFKKTLVFPLVNLVCECADDSETMTEADGIFAYISKKKFFGECAFIHDKYERVIWYGGGIRGRDLLALLPGALPHVIWDRKAEAMKTIDTIPCELPDYASLRKIKTLVVVCVDNVSVFAQVKAECNAVGAYSVCSWIDYYAEYRKTHGLGGAAK
jgi:hypothetical protein